MAVFDSPEQVSLRRYQSNDSSQVKTLQTYLKKWGYYSKSIDGDYGYYTEQAVMKYQRNYGLSVDGYFGPESAKKFNKVVEDKEQNDNKNRTTKEGTLDCTGIELKKNKTNNKETVETLQTMLQKLGYYKYKIDGDYGEETEKSVSAFQKAHGELKDDGWVGTETCPVLNKAYKDKLTTETQKKTSATVIDTTPSVYQKISYEFTVHPDVVVLPEPTGDNLNEKKGGSIDPNPNFDCNKINLKKGDKNENVTKLQTFLKAKGYYTRQIDADFGVYTEGAVKKLQTEYGQKETGVFDKEVCSEMKKRSTTGTTSKKKQKEYKFNDFISVNTNDDVEGYSHELTLKTTYSHQKMSNLRKLQKTTFNMRKGANIVYTHRGYISDLKVTHENDMYVIELQVSGYTAFLNQQVQYSKTAKRSVLLKELIELAGLKANVDLTGLKDDEYTIKQVTANTTDKTDNTGSGLVDVHGNDCTPTVSIAAYSFDIDKAGGLKKIGDSSANYAQDTANMSFKEVIKDLFRRSRYGRSPSYQHVYYNNEKCPKSEWNKSGTIWGNCADFSRLVKCLGDVHGVKVGIRHTDTHYYNLIEVNGKVYHFDLCFKDDGYCDGWGNEVCNNLTMRGGPWSK